MNRFTKTVVLSCCLLAVVSMCQAAVINPGIRGGFYFPDDKFYLGADAKIGLAMLYADPNIEYVFVDNLTLLTLNADGFFTLVGVPTLSVWAGGGLSWIYAKPKGFDSSSDIGVNLIAGLEFSFVLNPYLMVKWVIKPDDDFSVVGIGIRF